MSSRSSSASSSSPAPTAPATPTTKATALPPQEAAPTAVPPARTRRPRTGLKRLKFAVPAKMPLPVRALWASASPEAQIRAHLSATAILRTWLGKATREEAARDLGLSPLRFWQLSQQAVAGLVAGLLKQPRFRGGGGPAADVVEESAGVLRRRITALEKELDGAKRLIALLKELPTPRAAGPAPSGEVADGRTRRRRGRAQARVASAGGEAGDRGEARHGAS